MNLGAISRSALRAAQNESIESKLLVSKKIVRELEDVPSEASHRLCADLRSVLKSVTRDPSATAEQIHECGLLLARVRALDPRRNKRADDEESTPAKANTVTPKPAAPTPDGFVRGLIDPIVAVSRVHLKYGDSRPRWTHVENENLLQVALGDVPLDSHSVTQCWLAFGYEWKRLGGCFEPGKRFSDLMSPQAEWIQDAISAYVNHQQIPLPTPIVFSITDDIAWRS